MDFRPSFQKRALWVALVSGPLAIIIVVLDVLFNIATRPPYPADVYLAQTQIVRAEYFARNYLLVWLAGGPPQEDRFKEMTSSGTRLSLNPDPVTVMDINITDLQRTPVNVNTEWAFTLAASIVPPGGIPTRSFYRVTFVEHDGAFQAIVLPRLTTSGIVPIRVETEYASHAAVDGILGKTLANFAKAFLTPGDSGGSLGRYVSERFTAQPVLNSPYTSVRLTDVQFAGTVQPTDASPGQSLEVLATVRASMSTTTFTTMQLPVRATMTKNSQWLIDAITEPVDFGNVVAR